MTVVQGGTDGMHAAQLISGVVSVDAIENFLELDPGALAELNAGNSGNTNPTSGSALAKEFTLQAGQSLTFDWKFETDDYVPFNDFAFFSVSNEAIKLTDVFLVGDFGSSGWQTDDVRRAGRRRLLVRLRRAQRGRQWRCSRPS